MAITFNSCSDDDDNDDTGNPTKLVKSIKDGDITTFEYDSQNRVSKSIWDKGGTGSSSGSSYVTSTFVYENNKIIVTKKNVLDPSDTDVMTLYLNDGYLTKMKESDYYETYTYSNGYLSTIVYSDDDYTESFIWENGNITRIVGIWENGTAEWTYEYGDIANNLNVDSYILAEYFPKMKGTRSKNFPISCRSIYRSYGSITDDDTYSYSYTLDADGYPTKIIETRDDNLYGSRDVETTTITYY